MDLNRSNASSLKCEEKGWIEGFAIIVLEFTKRHIATLEH